MKIPDSPALLVRAAEAMDRFWAVFEGLGHVRPTLDEELEALEARDRREHPA